MPELPIGQPAPDFDWPDLQRRCHSPAAYCGRKMLLVFFGPQCGYCLWKGVPRRPTNGDIAEF
jgi:peroxiredoxin